jgi:putative flippase GtrA
MRGTHGNAGHMIERIISNFIKDDTRRALALQIIRFGVSGVFLTLLVVGGANVIEFLWHIDPNIAFAIAFVIGTGIGYLLHSNWSFKGHGSRDNAHIRTLQFFTVNILGFLLNEFFVWLFRKHFSAPFWVADLPIIFVTPLLSFSLNRKWVFA